MIDHLSTYATDYPKTKEFYHKVMAALGHELVMEFTADWNPEFPTQRMCAFGPPQQPIFWIIEVKHAASPRHIAFSAKDQNQVEVFHKEGLDNGGSNNGEPGLRPMYHEHYFAAFLFDPDGNNVEAVCHGPTNK